MARILIIGNERIMCPSSRVYLEDAGHEVTTAGDRGEAETLLDKMEFDVVLTEAGIPHNDSVEIFHLIRRKSPDTQIVLTRGEPSAQSAVEAVREQVFDYLTPPVDRKTLVRVVSEAARIKTPGRKSKRMTQEKDSGMDNASTRFEGWHRILVEHAGIGIGIYDLDGTVVLMNRKACKSMDTTPEEIIGRSASDVFGKELGDTIRRRMEEVIAAGESFIYEDKAHLPTGVRWFRSTYSPVPDDTGRYTGIMVISDDISDRKLAVQSLQESEEKYRSLFENMLNGFALHEIVLDEDGKPADYIFLDVNRAFERLTKMKRADILGRRVTKVIPGIGKDPGDWIGKYGTVALTGKEIRFEQYSEALKQWYSVLAFSPRKGQFVTIFEDITDRKRAENALRKSEEKHRSLIVNIPHVTWTAGMDATISFISPNSEEILHYAPEEILNSDYHFLVGRVHPDDADRAREAFRNLFEKGTHFDVEFRLKRKDGEWIWVNNKSVALHESEGMVYADGILTDITERKRAEMELKEERERAQTYLNLAGVMFIALDPDGCVILANPKSCEVLGYTEEELVGKNWFDTCVPERMREKIREIANSNFRGETELVEYFENPVLTSRGEERLIAWHNTTLRDDKRAIIFSLSSGEDITERKQAEKARIESERLLNQVGKIARIGGWEMDMEKGGEATWTKGTYDIAEIDREEPIPGADEHMNWYLPQYRAMIVKKMESLIATRQPIQFEAELQTKKGNVKWCHAFGETVEENGKLVKLRGTFQDITERKRTEEKIKDALIEIHSLKEQLEAENVYLLEEIRMAHLHGNIIGESKGILSTLAQAEQVAPTDSTVLILGETGTGKELLARAIHQMSSRKNRPMIVVNCAAIPDTLVESELFGREKGAYTGAHTKLVGRFEVANGSTIFLDEIGDLPFEIQAKLLRVLQEGQFERLGGEKTITVDVRVIAATNHDLEKEVRENTFREDLFYRLNVFPLTVPPLRERKEDIESLVWAFVGEFGERMGKRIDGISQKSMEALLEYSWPGNIRELRNIVERAMIQTKGKQLRISLPSQPSQSQPGPRTLAETERQSILETMKRTGWRIRGKGGAAELLDIKPTTLEARMKKLGIRRSETT